MTRKERRFLKMFFNPNSKLRKEVNKNWKEYLERKNNVKLKEVL